MEKIASTGLAVKSLLKLMGLRFHLIFYDLDYSVYGNSRQTCLSQASNMVGSWEDSLAEHLPYTLGDRSGQSRHASPQVYNPRKVKGLPRANWLQLYQHVLNSTERPYLHE